MPSFRNVSYHRRDAVFSKAANQLQVMSQCDQHVGSITLAAFPYVVALKQITVYWCCDGIASPFAFVFAF
jgi:hypothetical protein